MDDETMRAWRNDTPNPFDPRKPLDAAVARCEPLLHLYAAKAPRLADHIQQRLPEIVALILHDRRRVVESTDYCSETTEWYVAAHHCASGFQIRAGFSDDREFVKSVVAKPYSYPRLECPRVHVSWDEHVGLWEKHMFLGIGERLYKFADEKAGGKRWAMRSTTDYSDQLRRKLHHQDPFKWQDRHCHLCDAAGIDWKRTGPGQFPQH